MDGTRCSGECHASAGSRGQAPYGILNRVGRWQDKVARRIISRSMRSSQGSTGWMVCLCDPDQQQQEEPIPQTNREIVWRVDEVPGYQDGVVPRAQEELPPHASTSPGMNALLGGLGSPGSCRPQLVSGSPGGHEIQIWRSTPRSRDPDPEIQIPDPKIQRSRDPVTRTETPDGPEYHNVHNHILGNWVPGSPVHPSNAWAHQETQHPGVQFHHIWWNRPKWGMGGSLRCVMGRVSRDHPEIRIRRSRDANSGGEMPGHPHPIPTSSPGRSQDA